MEVRWLELSELEALLSQDEVKSLARYLVMRKDEDWDVMRVKVVVHDSSWTQSPSTSSVDKKSSTTSQANSWQCAVL